MPTSINEQFDQILEGALRRCEPASLIHAALERSKGPREVDVVAIGKCAAAMLRGVVSLDIRRSFVSVPEGYPLPHAATELRVGSHPQFSPASFEAGEGLLRFIDPVFPTLFLISGGSSACVEAPLSPWFDRDDLLEINRLLLRSGVDIEKINTVRKHLSAIKGGRLGTLAGPSQTVVLSDVARGALHLVGSGPTVGDPTTLTEAAAVVRALPGDEARTIAVRLESGEVPETSRVGNAPLLAGDNSTLVRAAADEAKRLGLSARVLENEMTGNVETVAAELYAIATTLQWGEVVIAGGEPVVTVRGEGRGGRCGEVAAHFALLSLGQRRGACGMFAASDGVDGNSGTAGAVMLSSGTTASTEEIRDALDQSDSRSILERIGRPIVMPPTGNNLRDLFIVARDREV